MVGHLVETSRIADLRSGFFGAVVVKTAENKSYLLIGGVLYARPKKPLSTPPNHQDQRRRHRVAQTLIL